MRGTDGGKFKRKLSEVITRAVSRGQNELIGKFKMAADDVIICEITNSYLPKRNIKLINHLIKTEKSEEVLPMNIEDVSRRIEVNTFKSLRLN